MIHERSAGWYRRRARNVYQRPLLVGSVALGVVILMVVGLVAVPRRLERVVGGVDDAIAPPDTAAIQAAVVGADARAAEADAALAHARNEVLGRAPVTVVDTFPPALRLRRDSLAALSAELASLLRRSEDAPLPTSYRALGGSAAMRGVPGIPQLLDTLAEVERSRADFGAAGGVDPIFLALTSRATQIGKRIQERAAVRNEALRREVVRLTPAPPRLATPTDTLRLALERDSAQNAATAARRQLAQARVVAEALEARAERERQIAAFGVPAVTLLLAALALGLALGFGVALAAEIRSPRVSDGAEAEGTTGARVLATIGRRVGAGELRRRRADQQVPALIALASDEYQLLYTQLADRAFNVPLLAVVGDDAMVTAVVAANLAAVVARQVRTTLLVDTDGVSRSASIVTRTRASRGLADVLAGRVEWSEVVRSVVVGRERTMDVLPSGAFGSGASLVASGEALSQMLQHLARRYECVIVSAPRSGLGTIPTVTAAVSDVIVCVRTGRTTLEMLRQLMSALAPDGATLRGIVLWDREDPAPLSAGAPDAASTAAADPAARGL